ncbi:MAG: T9SS type A sorting domain-containing protein, partial [Bacteroidia bacterium]|nr:T9SS type A sorting domain-containing protein [Bacteroidia bacterium]NNM23303.1 T9SS type A sorting domain-containing protein [Flavobacteriaceae bacterium]
YYICGDFSTGLIATVDPAGNFNNLGTFGGNWSSFGQDMNGELYVANYNGTILKIQGEILGTNDVDSFEVRIYPNPAQDVVNLEIIGDSIQSLRLSDLKGSLLFSKEDLNSSSAQIDIKSLAAGIYLVRIQSETGTVVKKLVIQ